MKASTLACLTLLGLAALACIGSERHRQGQSLAPPELVIASEEGGNSTAFGSIEPFTAAEGLCFTADVLQTSLASAPLALMDTSAPFSGCAVHHDTADPVVKPARHALAAQSAHWSNAPPGRSETVVSATPRLAHTAKDPFAVPKMTVC